MISKKEFVSLVDHTLLKPEATRQQIEQLCKEAIDLNTAAVCVNSYWVPYVSSILAATEVLACSVVGFPLGSMSPEALGSETAAAVAAGADEIDMVFPVGLFRSGDENATTQYITAAREVSQPDICLKVILETALLSDAEIEQACRLAVEGGADYVKTSTGFNPAGGATSEAVQLMRKVVGPQVGVKASGGIRSLDDVQRMVDAGASRLGMSAALAVISELENV